VTVQASMLVFYHAALCVSAVFAVVQCLSDVRPFKVTIFFDIEYLRTTQDKTIVNIE